MSFGERLQVLRRGNGMTQEEFAQQLKVSRQAVSKWESSRGYPEMEKIIYICNHYGVTMDELFRDEVPPPPGGEEDEAPPVAERQPLENQKLKKAFGNFFTNLSPSNQQLFAAGAVLVVLLLFILFAVIIMKGGSDQMILKIVWVALLVLLTIFEAVTVGLVSIWFAAGALAALICTLLGGPLWLQITLFIVVSALCLLAIRPLANKYFNNKVEPTNADRVLGAQAMVTEEIHNLQGSGAVVIGGITWTARSESDAPIPAGTTVRVLRIEGVKVYVEEVNTEAEVKEEASCQI